MLWGNLLIDPPARDKPVPISLHSKSYYHTRFSRLGKVYRSGSRQTCRSPAIKALYSAVADERIEGNQEFTREQTFGLHAMADETLHPVL